jgi:hypothetical protein
MRYYQIVIITLFLISFPIIASSNLEHNDTLYSTKRLTIKDTSLLKKIQPGQMYYFVDKKQLDLINKSEKLANAGIVSHISGLGITLIGIGILTNEIRENKPPAVGLSFLIPGSMLDLFGPLFSCAAEKKANELLESTNNFDTQLVSMKEYYRGCLYRTVGISLGFIRANLPEDASFTKFIFAFSQMTLGILSEVKMIKTIAAPYPKINRGRKKLKVSLVPSIGNDVYTVNLLFQVYK